MQHPTEDIGADRTVRQNHAGESAFSSAWVLAYPFTGGTTELLADFGSDVLQRPLVDRSSTSSAQETENTALKKSDISSIYSLVMQNIAKKTLTKSPT